MRKPVHPRIDLIPPLGTNLPPSHRRVYNRPSYWHGKIAYYIAPSSQEAMAWHDAEHRCAYKNHRPRIEVHYFYPKPWEVLKIGARIPTDPQEQGQAQDAYQVSEDLGEINDGEEEFDAPTPADVRVAEFKMLEE